MEDAKAQSCWCESKTRWRENSWMQEGLLGGGEGTTWADRAPKRYQEKMLHTGVKSPSAGGVLRTSVSPHTRI